MEKILDGKTGVILGVANKRSIAWGCAQSLARAGMRLAFTYAGERMEKAVRKLAEDVPDSLVLPCDVTHPEEIDEVFETVRESFGYLDTVVHAIAFARREELQGDFYHTTKDGYMLALFGITAMGIEFTCANRPQPQAKKSPAGHSTEGCSWPSQ